MTKEGGTLAPGAAHSMPALVDYSDGAVVSRTLTKGAAGTLTVFAFDTGAELSEHSAPFDAYVAVIEGKVELTIGGEKVNASAGEVVLMPADIPHAVRAVERFKMLLVMLKQPAS